MDVRTFYLSASNEERLKLASDAKTKVSYLAMLSAGFRVPSRDLALRLEAASNGKINAIACLFPNRIGPVPEKRDARRGRRVAR